MAVLAVLGVVPLDQEIYAAFMASFVNAKTYKAQTMASLRLMVSTPRKNERWTHLGSVLSASQELLMAKDLWSLSRSLAETACPDHATTKERTSSCSSSVRQYALPREVMLSQAWQLCW